MKLSAIFTVLTLLMVPVLAGAHGTGGHKNLKVLQGVDHKTLDKGMRDFTKGLGVKCTACHVKGKYDRDDVPAKAEALRLFETVVETEDRTRHGEALKAVLAAIDRPAAKNEAAVWSALEKLKRARSTKVHGAKH